MVDASRDVDPCELCSRTLRQVVQTLDPKQRRSGEPFCAVPACPLYQRLSGFLPVRELKGDSIYGPSPPSLFVGRVGWPVVSAGPLVPPGEVSDAPLMDDPTAWAKMDLAQVLTMRSGLVRSKARVKVHDAKRLDDATGALVTAQELAMATRPAHTELTLTKHVSMAINPVLHGFAAPTGPSVTVKRAALTENTSVPRRVDAAVDDVHATAADTVHELFRGGTSTYHIQRLFSVGLLGRQRTRRFVPTRWSVTATDDLLGKAMMPRVRHHSDLNDIEMRTSTLHGNRFAVVFMPGPWKYEMAEAWYTLRGGRRRVSVLVDSEGESGRTTYADSITGAYYAARLPIIEHLERRGRRGTAVVLREITDDYFAPAGVWVIREGVRQALDMSPTKPADIDDLVKRVEAWCPRIPFLAQSSFIRDRRVQRTLDAFS